MRVVFEGCSGAPPAGSIMRGKLVGMPVEVDEAGATSVTDDGCTTILDGMDWLVKLSVPVGMIDVGAFDEDGVIAGPLVVTAEPVRSVDVAVPAVAGVEITPLEPEPDTTSVFVLDAPVVIVPDGELPVDPETEVEPPRPVSLPEVTEDGITELVVKPVVVPGLDALKGDAPEGDAVLEGDTPAGTPVVEVCTLTSDGVAEPVGRTEPLSRPVEDGNTPLAVVFILADATLDIKTEATLLARLVIPESITESKPEIPADDVGRGATPPVDTGVAVTGAVSVEPGIESRPDMDAGVGIGSGTTPLDETAAAVGDKVKLEPRSGITEGTLDGALGRSDVIGRPVDSGNGRSADNDIGITVIVGAEPLAPDRGRMPGSTLVTTLGRSEGLRSGTTGSTLVAALGRSEVTGTGTTEGAVSGTTPPAVTGVAGTPREMAESADGIGIGIGTMPVSVGALLTGRLVSDGAGAMETAAPVGSTEATPPMSEVRSGTIEETSNGTTGIIFDADVEADPAVDASVVSVGLELEVSVPVGRGTTTGTVPEGPKRVLLRASNADDRSDTTGWSPVMVAAEGLVLSGVLELDGGRVPKGPKMVLEPEESVVSVVSDVPVVVGEGTGTRGTEIVGNTIAGSPSVDPLEEALDGFEVSEESEELFDVSLSGKPPVDPTRALEIAFRADPLSETGK